MRLRVGFVILCLCLLFVPATAQDNTLTLVTHDSFNVSEDVLSSFEESTGITVEILRTGDAGQLVNQSVLSAGNPLGDVLFGVDNTFLSRALNADLFIPYESPLLENVDAQFILDDEHRVTPVDFGDVCLNYDIGFFEENDLSVPQSLLDLTLPQYEGVLVVENPTISSPGLAFLLVTVEEFGTPENDDDGYTYLDFWADLVENDVLVAQDWSTAYFGNFTQGSEDGTYPLVVSYASSPPVTFSEELGTVTTRSIVVGGSCFRQIEFAGILDGTDKVEEAQQFIDFMLNVEFQEDMPLQMFVFPVHEEAQLPERFAEFAQIPDEPVQMDFERIAANRDDWIAAWNEVVLSR